MASGFSGGGPEFYAEITGRSVNNVNPNANNMTQNPYRITNPQLSRIFLDQTTTHQIAPQRATASSNFTSPSFIGKRTLADFQHQNHHQQGLNPALSNLLLRSVKPRMYQNTWPVEFSGNNMISPEVPSFSSQQRYGLPLLQQLGRNPINLNPQSIPPSLPYMNALQQQQQGRGVGGGGVAGPQDSEKKMMNQLQELEKQLLDDNDDGADDTVSVITSSNSEWSDTIQSIINISTSSTNPVAPSPTSSSSSSSSINSVLNCSRQTLLEAASAISEGKTELATEILTRINHASNAKGNSEQKLMDYMFTALKSRVNPVDNPPPVRELYSKEHFASTHLLYELSPCLKQSFMAANSAILDATLDLNNSSNAFHVIDFDIGQGTQHGLLLYALSERLNGKTAIVKVTAVPDNGADEERLRAVGDKLSQIGERLGISLRFNVVSCKLSDLNRDSLGCEPEEVLAVNFAFKLFRMADESVSMENPRDELLRRVKGLSPRVVTLVEQEMNGNTAPFLTRVNEACAYYGALLESIESSVQKDINSERVKAVEEALGRKLANSVACEGRDRVERCEVFGKWRARMGMAGFELKPMNQTDVESIKSSMGSANRPNPGFSIKEQNGGLWFGWMGKTLAVASAWR